jgi:hypothetical protein
MEKNSYICTVEPRGKMYRNLLDYALMDCKFFLLVTLDEIFEPNPSTEQVFDALSFYLIKAEKKNGVAWNGSF